MAGPLIGGRRPISWRLAIVVAFIAAYATARWLEGIFGVGQISGTVSFLVLVGPCALFGHRFTVGELEGRRRQLLCQGLRYVSRRGHTKRPAQRPAIVLGEDA